MLKKVTKTIPLAGGEQDDAPEFLLEPPGMAYVQNARFRKQDSTEKTEPTEYIGTPLTVGSSAPGVLFDDGNRAVTLGSNTIDSYYSTANLWTSEVLDRDILGIENVLSTIEESGGVNYVWANISTVNGGEVGYCVAFERRKHSIQQFESGEPTRNNPKVDVVIRRYSQLTATSEYTMYDERLVDDACSPVTQTLADGRAVVYYVGTQSKELWQQTVPWVTTAFPAAWNISVTGDIITTHQAFDDNGKWNGLDHDRLRPGFTYNARYHAALKYVHNLGDDRGALAYKTDNADGTIYIRVTSGTGVSGEVSFLSDTAPTSKHSLLDIAVDNNHYYVLEVQHDTTVTGSPPGDGTTDHHAVVHRLDGSFGTPLDNRVVSSGTSTVAQGSLRVVDDGSVRCAVNIMTGDPWTQGLYTKRNGLRFYHITNTFNNSTLLATLLDHRLASNLVINGDDNLACVVQQFSNTNPNNSEETNNAFYSALPASVKPVTSTLVEVDASFFDKPNEYPIKPIAVMDSGQSKDKLASYAEQNIHYGTLYFDSDGYWYGNSVTLTGEDYSYNMDSVYPSGAGETELRRSLLVGESKFNVYRCSHLITPSSSVLNRSFLYNSALPLWFANGDVTEISVIDQPEITYLNCYQADGTTESRADGPILSYSATAVDNWVAFQAVVGFFDASGHVHRSAPSFPVFVENAFEGDDAGPYISAKVNVSVPISFRGQQFFAEVYTAAEGDEFQLAGATYVDTSDTSSSIELDIILNNSNAGDEQYVYRSSESLYTTGGVLPTDPWPNMKQTTSSSRRLFGLSEAAPGTIFYSKLFEENVAPEFSASLVISTGSFRELTAIKAIDDKIFIFEKDRIHFLYGSGPDNTGANGDFIVERMQTTLGCIDPQSLVTTPDGLMFYSSVTGEFHLITRDLQIVDVGKPVMDLSEGIDVTASLLYQQEHEVRFFVTGSGSLDWGPEPNTDTGTPPRPPRPRMGRSTPAIPNSPSPTHSILTYNYHYKKWSVLTSYDGTGTAVATTLRNKPIMLNNAWVGSRVISDIADGGQYASWPSMVWETPWIKVNQLQDYGRFYWATILGKYLSSWTLYTGAVTDSLQAGDLKVTVKYDYEGLNGDTDEYTFRANRDFDPTEGERLQFRVRPGRQKCQALKFIIEEQVTEKLDDSEPNYTLGRGFELTAIDLVYGAKGGSSRNFGIRRQK